MHRQSSRRRCGYGRSWSASFRTGKSMIRTRRAVTSVVSTKRSEQKIDFVPFVCVLQTNRVIPFGIAFFVLAYVQLCYILSRKSVNVTSIPFQRQVLFRNVLRIWALWFLFLRSKYFYVRDFKKIFIYSMPLVFERFVVSAGWVLSINES